MKNLRLTVLTAIIFCSLSGFSQEDEILIENVGSRVKFSQKGKQLKPRDMLTIMQKDERAYSAMRTSLDYSALSTILGFAGGYGAGWQMANALRSKPTDSVIISASGVAVIMSIITANASEKGTIQAVETYNSNLFKNRLNEYVGMTFGLNSSGMSICFTF